MDHLVRTPGQTVTLFLQVARVHDRNPHHTYGSLNQLVHYQGG